MQEAYIKKPARGKKSWIVWVIIFIVTLAIGIVLLATGQFKNFWAEVLYKQADRTRQTENFERVIEILDKVTALNPEHALAHYDLGVACIDAGKKDRAVRQIAVLHKLKRSDLAGQLEKLLIQSKYRIIRGTDPFADISP